MKPLTRFLLTFCLLAMTSVAGVAWVMESVPMPNATETHVQAESAGGPVITAPTVQEPALKALAADIHADVTNINLDYQNFSDSNQLAEYDDVSDGQHITYYIHVRPGQESNMLRVSFAHEYYHYVWATHPEVKAIAPELRGMYATDKPMQFRMEYYVKEGIDPNSEKFANELLAIYCSETMTTALPQDVQHTCLQWEDLSKITALRNSL